LTALGRYWRTLRWLKREQIVGRLRFKFARPAPDLAAAPAPRAQQGSWVHPPLREPSLIAPTCWRLLGETHDLAEIGWDSPHLPLLWRYHQHYFDDLNARGAETRRDWHSALISRWIAENPPARGTGWASYPVSLRIVNWIKAALAGHALAPGWEASLAVQTRWLARRLEWHLLGNHLFANAKALVYAGLWFEGAEAAQWLGLGIAILERELPEQVLADGGQFERTPMYHALALEDVLDLINLCAARAGGADAQALAARLRDLAPAMLHWLRCMTHTSGSFARFNDSTDGASPALADLERYADALRIAGAPASGEGVHALQPSGYVRVVRGAAVALLDVAPIGPDYLPGHAHADTLSFELEVGARELIVNRGTSVYGTGARRQLERGTAAHSTVQLGAHDSSEVWSGFRVGRRARVRQLAIDGWQVEAAHDGYTHLPGAPRHRRRWRFEPRALLVEDHLPGAAVARYHLAPGLDVREQTRGCWRVADGAQAVASLHVEAGLARIEPWQHALGFGRLVDAQTLVVELVDGCARVRIDWAQ
jgi:uncharacterized heparinase superfamily protein